MDNRTAISLRHRLEWQRFRAVYEADNDVKYCKALADVLKVYQEGQRKAHAFADTDIAEFQEVANRQCYEWDIFCHIWLEAIFQPNALEAAKEAKANADILKVYQEAERRAFGFTDAIDEDDSDIDVSFS